eukprot:12911140-Prorocentrum_lima.AAC.1
MTRVLVLGGMTGSVASFACSAAESSAPYGVPQDRVLVEPDVLVQRARRKVAGLNIPPLHVLLHGDC